MYLRRLIQNSNTKPNVAIVQSTVNMNNIGLASATTSRFYLRLVLIILNKCVVEFGIQIIPNFRTDGKLVRSNSFPVKRNSPEKPYVGLTLTTTNLSPIT